MVWKMLLLFCVFRELSKSRTLLAISLEQIKHGAGKSSFWQGKDSESADFLSQTGACKYIYIYIIYIYYIYNIYMCVFGNAAKVPVDSVSP